MSGFGKNTDIDGLIVSYLDPPQILTMSEVNQYFNQLAADRRMQFIKVKTDIEAAIKTSNEWILRWHMANWSKYTNQKKLIEILQSSFLYNNYYFAEFILEKSVHDFNHYVKLELSHSLRFAYFGTYDPKFIMHVEECMERFYKIRYEDDLPQEFLVFNYMIRIMRQKNVESVAAWINKHKMYIDGLSLRLKTFVGSEPQFLSYFDSEFIDAVCTLLNCTLTKTDYQSAINKACVLKESGTFFKIIAKFSSYVDHQEMFGSACEGGHHNIVEWFINNSVTPIRFDLPDPVSNITCFETACKHNKSYIVDVLINLSQQSPDKHGHIDIHRRRDLAFTLACRMGHIGLAKYLLERCEQFELGPINIHSRPVLLAALMGQHYDVAKWLLDISTTSYGKFDLSKVKDFIVRKYHTEHSHAQAQLAYGWLRELPTEHIGQLCFDKDHVPLMDDDSYQLDNSDIDLSTDELY